MTLKNNNNFLHSLGLDASNHPSQRECHHEKPFPPSTALSSSKTLSFMGIKSKYHATQEAITRNSASPCSNGKSLTVNYTSSWFLYVLYFLPLSLELMVRIFLRDKNLLIPKEIEFLYKSSTYSYYSIPIQGPHTQSVVILEDSLNYLQGIKCKIKMSFLSIRDKREKIIFILVKCPLLSSLLP